MAHMAPMHEGFVYKGDIEVTLQEVEGYAKGLLASALQDLVEGFTLDDLEGLRHIFNDLAKIAIEAEQYYRKHPEPPRTLKTGEMLNQDYFALLKRRLEDCLGPGAALAETQQAFAGLSFGKMLRAIYAFGAPPDTPHPGIIYSAAFLTVSAVDWAINATWDLDGAMGVMCYAALLAPAAGGQGVQPLFNPQLKQAQTDALAGILARLGYADAEKHAKAVLEQVDTESSHRFNMLQLSRALQEGAADREGPA